LDLVTGNCEDPRGSERNRGTGCGETARPGLCGGRPVTGVPTTEDAMDKNLRRTTILLFVISAPFFGYLCFVLLSLIFGPLLIDYFGESVIKGLALFATLLILFFYWINLYKQAIDRETNRRMGRPFPDKKKYNRHIRLAMAILSFAMAPFGFDGQFVRHGEPTITLRIMGGFICLLAGSYFLFLYFQDKKRIILHNSNQNKIITQPIAGRYGEDHATRISPLGMGKIKNSALILIIITILGLSAASYSDYRTFTKRKSLYSESLKIQALIAKYEAIQNEADDIREKVGILKRKEIDDFELQETIKKSESFITEAESVRAKHIELINKYNQISERYNGLASQKFLFKNRLPGNSTWETPT
jgi:hypothetical protein